MCVTSLVIWKCVLDTLYGTQGDVDICADDVHAIFEPIQQMSMRVVEECDQFVDVTRPCFNVLKLMDDLLENFRWG